MTEFKVGEKVNVIESLLGPFYGRITEVNVNDPELLYRVVVEGGDAYEEHGGTDWWVLTRNVESNLPTKRPLKLGDVVQLTCGGVHMTVTGAIGDPMYDGKLRTTVAVDTGILRQDFGGQRWPDCRHYAPECLVLVKAVDE